MAAQSLGYKVVVLDPGFASPAGGVGDRHIRADYQDPQALAELAQLAAAATTEFENVPAGALEYLARSLRVTPSAASVAIAQDRISEKTFLAGQGFAVTPFAVLRTEAEARAADPAARPGNCQERAPRIRRQRADSRSRRPPTLSRLSAKWAARRASSSVSSHSPAKCRSSWPATSAAKRSHGLSPRTCTVTGYSTSRSCRRACPLFSHSMHS